MSQNKDFDEKKIRKDLLKLSKSQLIKKCKKEKVSTSSSKTEMVNALIKTLQQKHVPKTNALMSLIKKKKRKTRKGTDRSKLLKLFKTRDDSDEFFEFVSNHSQEFVSTVIGIILDRSADSEPETDISTLLFHELRSSPELWVGLTSSAKAQLKRKLLNGIHDLDGSNKVDIFAHIVAIIATFEEWDELVSAIVDLSSCKYGKLKLLQMLASWSPEQLQKHSAQILKAVYAETLAIDESTIDSFSSRSLFSVMDTVIKDVDDIPLIQKVMKITIVFLLKLYVTNHKECNLVDSNLNINKSAFDELDLDIMQSYDAAAVCFGLLCKAHHLYFDHLTLQFKDDLFFVSNVFLKLSGTKVNYGLVVFAEDRNEWDEEAWDFAKVSQSVFSIFYQMKENELSVANVYDYFAKYFKETKETSDDQYHLIENIVSNINYDDIAEAVVCSWTHWLQVLATNYVQYFWHKKDLFIPLLQQKHPTEMCLDMSELRKQLYNQEWLAVRYFVRNNYSKLYDQLRIPIMEMILKYLSEYLSIDIIMKDNDEIFDRMELEYDFVNTNQDVTYDPNAIDYNITNQMIPDHQRKCLISGFIKTLKTNVAIPNAIDSIIYRFYPWLLEQFDVYKQGDFTLENEKTLATLITSGHDRTIYGKINIEPSNKDIHQWTFKVLSAGQISFGIDEYECKSIDGGFIAPSETRSHYGYAFSGGKFCMEKNYKPYGSAYGVDDTITMIFDANERTLRFYKNDIDQKILADQIDYSKTFKMAVGLYFSEDDVQKGIPNSSVSLIEYKCATYNANK